MSIAKTFTDQYNRSKEIFQNALNNNYSIVVCGEGRNGKSHLVNEFKKELEKKKYYHMYVGDYNDYTYEDELDYVDEYTSLIIEANNYDVINNIYVGEHTNGLVFINMSKLKNISEKNMRFILKRINNDLRGNI